MQFGQPARGVTVHHAVDGVFEIQCLLAVDDQLVQQRLFRRIGGQGGTSLLIDLDIAQQHPPGMGRGGIGPHPVFTHDPVDIPGMAAQLHQPDPQIEILGLRHRGIEAANRVEIGPSERGADIDAEAAVQHVGQGPALPIARPLLGLERQPFLGHCAKDQGVARGQPDLGIALQQVGHGAKVVRAKAVVPIQQGNQRCARGGNRGVARTGYPLIRRCQEPDARIGQIGGDRPGHVIGRTIVDHHAFPVRAILRQQRIQGFAQQMRHAIGRHDHRNARDGKRIGTVCDHVHVRVITRGS